MRFQVFVGALLIGTHQARVSRHIGGEDRGEATGRGHGSAGPLLQGFGSLNYTTIRASRYAADEPFRTSAVSVGPSRYQNGGYPLLCPHALTRRRPRICSASIANSWSSRPAAAEPSRFIQIARPRSG